MNKQSIYFPNLNGLRFFAALLVILHHVGQFKSLFKSGYSFDIISVSSMLGQLGVILFFVLSGFLITYLLLAEEQRFKRISIKNFYIRRIFRIWPLYFLIIILALFVLPNINLFILPGYGKEIIYVKLTTKIILFILFFPNLLLAIYGMIPYASQTWSIGTEEQFYLIWPLALNFFKNNRIILMLFIILSYLFISEMLYSCCTDFLPYRDAMKGFWNYFNIDCMAIGGIYAILLFQKNSFIKFIMNNYLFYGTIVVVSVLMITEIQLSYYKEIYACLFGIIILNFAANDKIHISLENRFLNYLGKISYGLYMYHLIGIVLALYLTLRFNVKTDLVLYPLSLIFTIFLAILSYKYFESIFLNFKLKFSNIISGKET